MKNKDKRRRDEPCKFYKNGHRFSYYDHLCRCGAWEGNFQNPELHDDVED